MGLKPHAATAVVRFFALQKAPARRRGCWCAPV